MKLVKIVVDGDEIDVHLGMSTGEYATICGLDGGDCGQQTIPTNPGDKITCATCKSIIAHCKQVKPSLIG